MKTFQMNLYIIFTMITYMEWITYMDTGVLPEFIILLYQSYKIKTMSQIFLFGEATEHLVFCFDE